MSAKTERNQKSKDSFEMQMTYEASEWLLESRLDDLGYLVYKLRVEAVTLGVGRPYFDRYMREKILTMLDESIDRHAVESKGVKGVRNKSKLKEK